MEGNQIADNSAALQECLDNNAPSSDHLIYVDIPAGAFVFREPITLPSGEVLLGTSETSTRLLWQPGIPSATTFITVGQFSGLASLEIEGPSTSALVSSSDIRGNPRLSGHIFVKDVSFVSTGNAVGPVGLVQVAGPDIQIYNSTFDSASCMNLAVFAGDGAILRGNTFIEDRSFVGIEGSQNIIVENNSVFSRTGPNPNGSSFIQLSRPFGAWAPSMLLQDIYVGYNTIQNIGSATNQIILTDGGGGAYYGGIISSTAKTVTLANDPSWKWIGNSNPLSMTIAIISGTGVGQYSRLSGFNARTLDL